MVMVINISTVEEYFTLDREAYSDSGGYGKEYCRTSLLAMQIDDRLTAKCSLIQVDCISQLGIF